MRATSIIFRRELGGYLRSPLGWVVAALALFLDGVLFQAMALGGDKRLSAGVLNEFFRISSGVTMGVAIVLSIRLLAEERQNSTLVLLNTSPVRDVEIVLGKYFAALAFLAFILMLSIYMPLLVLVNGKISVGQVLVGYLGLFLIGATALAMGTFASALTRHQLVAGAIGGVLVVASVLLYYLAKVLDPPLRSQVAALDLYSRHFPPFQLGVLHLRDVVFYVAVSYFFLLLAVKTVEAKRWQ